MIDDDDEWDLQTSFTILPNEHTSLFTLCGWAPSIYSRDTLWSIIVGGEQDKTLFPSLLLC